VAVNAYREGATSNLRRTASPREGAFERLEPCEGKLSRTVLRGRGGSNAALLPGEAITSDLSIAIS